MFLFTEFYKSFMCLKIILLCHVAAISKPNSQVEVRAVFIKCEPDERQTLALDNEVSRFEREELYKHSALRDCSKKLAVTVKLASAPDMNSEDEYIPIEHVLQGSRRIRLLDPYVMRLRRERPYQAYKLKKIKIVSGVFSYTDDSHELQRFQRSSDILTTEPLIMDYSNSSLHKLEKRIVGNYDYPRNYSNIIDVYRCSNKRDKRKEHNLMIENVNEDKIPEIITDKIVHKKNKDLSVSEGDIEHHYTEEHDHFERNKPMIDLNTNVNPIKQPAVIRDVSYREEDDKYRVDKTKHRNSHNINWQKDEQIKKKHHRNVKDSKSEQQLIVYEIDSPDVWSTVHLQLFEKLSTPEGKTVWNDLSKGELASVSSLFPEWHDRDLNVRYRTEWIPRENFTVPISHVRLLTPQEKNEARDTDEERIGSLKYGEYVVVPKEDIVNLENTKTVVKKLIENDSEVQPAIELPRVMVRMSRALLDSKADKMSVESHRGEQYLKIPYKRVHQAQIDLEARADGNQLVNVGTSGRIMTIVSDNTRRTRTIMNVQIMNTGLMAAHFSIKPRDCGPEIQSDDDESSTDTANDDLILLPPRHTRYVRLMLPNEMPSESTHCSVALVSDTGDSVAVRDVTIKKGDRCYCVWHCECVCLSDDPKLICEEMPDTRQVAAGLSLRERPRHVRSVCYHDAPSVNVVVTFFGVLIVLFMLGFLKAIWGLIFRCIGSWGIDRIVQMPRQLDRYYEKSLQKCCVQYDKEGWPVHPVTRKRTVRLVSKSMEFLLNLVFFIVLPCRLIYDILKQICKSICKPKQKAAKVSRNCCEPPRHSKQVESDCGTESQAQDIQESNPRHRRRRRRRRNRLRRWMTNEAEELSTYLWQKSLRVEQFSNTTSMRPLIQEGGGPTLRKESPNSDEDDTEFVLSLMQKSRESLAKSQSLSGGAAAGGVPTDHNPPRSNGSGTVKPT